MTNWPSAPRGLWHSAQERSRSRAGTGIPLWLWLTIGGGAIGLGLVIAMGVVIASAISAKAEDRQALRELEQSSEAFRQKQMNPNVPASEMGAEYDNYVLTFEQKGATMGGAEGNVVRAASAMMRSMQPEVTAYAQAMERLEQAGGLDPSMLKSKSDIDGVSKSVKDLKAASTRLSERVKSLPDMFVKELRGQHVKDSDVRAALAGFRAAANIDLALESHEEDRRGCDLMLKMLDLLKREWGRWSVDAATGEVEFKSASVTAQYNRCMGDLAACSLRQEQLQQQLMQAQRRAAALGGGR
jgi:hypothetical protein